MEAHDAVELVDGALGVLGALHGNEAEASRAVSLRDAHDDEQQLLRAGWRASMQAHLLVVDDDDLFDPAMAGELVLEVDLAGAHTQSEHTKHVGGFGHLNESGKDQSQFTQSLPPPSERVVVD